MIASEVQADLSHHGFSFVQGLFQQLATLQAQVAELNRLQLVERFQGIEGDIVLSKNRVEDLSQRVNKVETRAKTLEAAHEKAQW